MQPIIYIELPSIPEFKRRRCEWVRTVRQRSYNQYHLLDLSDDVLMVVMRRLLPSKETLRGRDLVAYRDVANLAFTCRRLLKLFRMVRTTPVEVCGLFYQLAIDPSPQGQIRYPPVGDIQFFRNLIGDSGTALRRLTVPFLSAVHTSTLIEMVFSVCFHLEALHLADAGTLLSRSSELLSKSPIDHLRIYFPTASTLTSLSWSEKKKNWIWHCGISIRAFDCRFFETIKNHEALSFRRHKRKLIIQLKDSSSVNGILEVLYPLLVSRLSLLRYIERLETEHESRLIVTTSNASELGILLLEKATSTEDMSGTDEKDLRTLYIRSHRAVDSFLHSNPFRKESIRGEVKRVDFLDVRITLANWNSYCRLMKCLSELFDDQNEVCNLQISREIVLFSHVPETVHFLQRFKALKRIHFSEPVRIPNTTRSSYPVTDKMFLEHLPTLLRLLHENCKGLETVNMSSCFPSFPFEKRRELRPWIDCALGTLTQLESNSRNLNMDGIRRVLLRWLERVNLVH